jgi:hypothetical protein
MPLNHSPDTTLPDPIAALRRFSRPRADTEHCDLCAAPIPASHAHLLEPANRKLHCACEACAILFSANQSQKFRRVPQRLQRWPDFHMTDAQWAGLGVPIALAFFVYNSSHQQLNAIYPSPGGPTETLLPFEAWEPLVQENPALAALEPDVEALLVNRTNGARDVYRAGIDECYKLIGIIRTHWRGLSGGKNVWHEIDRFFQQLNARATRTSGVAHA